MAGITLCYKTFTLKVKAAAIAHISASVMPPNRDDNFL